MVHSHRLALINLSVKSVFANRGYILGVTVAKIELWFYKAHEFYPHS